MTDKKKSETCLLSVFEGDVKLILINVERRGKVEQGPHLIGFLFLLRINDVGEQQETQQCR